MIYRFRPFDIRTISSLLKSELYFSDPKDFNDPFDCQIPIDFNPKALKNNLEFKNVKLPKEVYGNIHICCFSRERDNILQWSHYADSHRGICLGFGEDNDIRKWNRSLIFVDYAKKMPKINYFKILNELIKTDRNLYYDINGRLNSRKLFTDLDAVIMIETVGTKQLEWKYEQEARILSSTNGNLKYPKELLKEIIFGFKLKNDDKIIIKGMISSAGYKSVKYFDCTPSFNNYKINVSEYVE